MAARRTRARSRSRPGAQRSSRAAAGGKSPRRPFQIPGLGSQAAASPPGSDEARQAALLQQVDEQAFDTQMRAFAERFGLRFEDQPQPPAASPASRRSPAPESGAAVAPASGKRQSGGKPPTQSAAQSSAQPVVRFWDPPEAAATSQPGAEPPDATAAAKPRRRRRQSPAGEPAPPAPSPFQPDPAMAAFLGQRTPPPPTPPQIAAMGDVNDFQAGANGSGLQLPGGQGPGDVLEEIRQLREYFTGGQFFAQLQEALGVGGE